MDDSDGWLGSWMWWCRVCVVACSFIHIFDSFGLSLLSHHVTRLGQRSRQCGESGEAGTSPLHITVTMTIPITMYPHQLNRHYQYHLYQLTRRSHSLAQSTIHHIDSTHFHPRLPAHPPTHLLTHLSSYPSTYPYTYPSTHLTPLLHFSSFRSRCLTSARTSPP